MKNKKKAILFNSIMLILVLFFLTLLFNKQIKYGLLNHQTKQFQNQIVEISPQELAENKSKPANFDFDQVQPISDTAILKSQAQLLKEKSSSNKNNGESEGSTIFNTTGYIAIPSVGINLPIFLGLANENLLYGTGTVKPDQELGKGNYVLASHRADRPNLLFSPLSNIDYGANIYVTDKTIMYEYKVNEIMEVDPSRGDLINDVKNRNIITLITCNDVIGSKRLIVIGDKVSSWSFENAPIESKKAFDLPILTY